MIQFASHVAPASSAASVPKLAAIERTNHLVQDGRPAHDGLTPHLHLEGYLTTRPLHERAAERRWSGGRR